MNLRFLLASCSLMLVALLMPATASAFGSCTDGVDCFCDTVNQSDPSFAVCLDWEDLDYYEDTGDHPWHQAPSGQSGFRGGDGIWQNTFDAVVGDCSWNSGQPSNPKLGAPCGYGACAAAAEWRPDDRYDGNSRTCIDIQRNGDVDKEISGLSLAGGHGGEVWDGQTHFAHRIRTNSPSALGGDIASFNRDMGITFARAYSTNLLSANSEGGNWISQPWKGNQSRGGLQFPEGNTGGNANNPPFSGGTEGITSNGNCVNAVNNADLLIGNIHCQDQVFRHGAAKPGDCNNKSTCNATNEFNRQRDWPLGTWACVRAFWGGMGTNNAEIYIDFQGPNDSAPRRIFHVRNLNSSQVFGSNANIGSYFFDAYYNGHQSGGDAANETFYRYMDNFHGRSGEPIGCDEIGFGSTAPPPPPSGGPPPPVMVP